MGAQVCFSCKILTGHWLLPSFFIACNRSGHRDNPGFGKPKQAHVCPELSRVRSFVAHLEGILGRRSLPEL